MFDYLKKIIKSQWKMYSFLILILLCLSSFEFVLLSIYSCFEINQGIDTLILRFIPTLGVFVSMFLTLLMNNYFLESKKKNFQSFFCQDVVIEKSFFISLFNLVFFFSFVIF